MAGAHHPYPELTSRLDLLPPPHLTSDEREIYDILFPPLPNYGNPTFGKRLKWKFLGIVAFWLYMTGILITILAGIPTLLKNALSKEAPRPFQEEERRRAEAREREERAWERKGESGDVDPEIVKEHRGWVPTEGGKDRSVQDVGYYARRVGLDSEEVKVQTEDGHVLVLWHIFDPNEYTPLPPALRGIRGPESIDSIHPPSRKLEPEAREGNRRGEGGRKYPVLMIHGLLQSAGVYCTNDENSLAFWLCKEGFDVWLGNCRAGFVAEHVELGRRDPEMWNWDLRHMATLDLPALTARVLSETSFPQLALVGHSQGTTATLIALSRFGRPSLSSKISVANLLAPAFYAAPILSHKSHFRLLRQFPVSMFMLMFGLTSFIPIMGALGYLHGRVPESWIGKPSYASYRFLFDWTDLNWDRGVRDRGFMFAPTFISARCMAWWLGRGGFADRGCVLSTKEDLERENMEDLLFDFEAGAAGSIHPVEASVLREKLREEEEKGIRSESWYPPGTSPLAFWVADNDELVDGRKLLNRFKRGREPNAVIAHEHVVKGYEHLDVVWSCDIIERVGWEIRDVIWRTVEVKDSVRIPRGCRGFQEKELPMLPNSTRGRMAEVRVEIA
ncbi:related to triacylglycerol lipase [Phialocephala subalpina]|uniref:Related to triacylglycerol lipase n=1 Tax=Phialocephala subalpina TaxID=576137 RepID=A0A1L7X0S7_9HELO|nr:related to triacylglycerol lipase [Phialocephala subalpina]